MSEHLQLPPKEVLASFKGLTLPDLSNNQRLLAGPQAALLGSADSVSSILIAAGLLQQPDHKEKLVDAAYLP